MDFDFTPDQDSLRDAVARWADKAYGFERRRAIASGGGFSREAWSELAELGLLGLALPESAGGMGFGAVEAMVVMEVLGHALVVEPYAAVALVAAPLLAASAAPQAAKLARDVASGSAIVVLAHHERGARHSLAKVRARALRDAAGAWTVSGTKSLVPAGAHADAFVVAARVSGADDDPQGIALFLVERGAQVATRGYPTQDGACAAELVLDRAPAVELFAPGAAFDALDAANDRAIAALAAEAVGVMDRMFALTVEYMNTRKQFGVAIASFQALRHRIADVKIQLELARSMSYFASLRLGDERGVRRRALSQAKVQLGNSMRFVGQQCIQLHGGIGMTDEYLASHCFKRLTMIELACGDTLHHLGEVAARMQDGAGVFA